MPGNRRDLALTAAACRRLCGAGLVLLALMAHADAASVYLPRLAFRVFLTPHFRIYYHQGSEAQARRLAGIAESVRAELEVRTKLPAPQTTHVVLANQDDDPNGLATPLPYPTVRIATAWPATSDLIANTDDWLRVVFIHEYVHVIQLERTRGWAKAARAILGRSPISFPNLFLPQWQIEGYATYWESRLTGLGRLNGGDARAVVTERARAGALPLDQAGGGLVEWPNGNAAYLEGAWFYDYLTSRFGDDAVGALSNRTAGRLPYLSAPAFEGVFQASLGDLWRAFQQQIVSSQPQTPAEGAGTAQKLTDRGYWVSSPRFDTSSTHVLYFLRDADGFPSVRQVPVDAPAGRPAAIPPSRAVVSRFGGRFLSVRQGLVFFDELELRTNVAWRSDLRVADVATGRTQRLSDDGRLLEPDVSPDGRQLACVRVDQSGRRLLAFYTVERDPGGRLSLAPAHTAITSPPGATFGAPRWSPDGRRLAVERRLIDGPSEIVVLERDDGAARVVASSSRGRSMTPAWMPDGTQVLFASDRAGRVFQIYAADLATGRVRQVTDVAGGASFPDVSADGRLVAFVGAGPAGYDVFTVPVDESRWTQVVPAVEVTGAGQSAARSGEPPPVGLEPRRYSPIPTLLPRSWTPFADTEDGQLRLGFGVDGTDILARHTYAVSAMWHTLGSSAGAPQGRPDWSASYVYDRWRPALFLSVSDSTSFLQISQSLDRPPVSADLREQNLTAGVALPFQRVRHAQLWQVAFNGGRDTLTANVPTAGDGATLVGRAVNRNALRSAWAVNSSKQYGRSISTEDGVAAAITSEQVRDALGADGNADAFTGEVRAFWGPGASHAVIAARAGYGVATGDIAVRRRFYLGGSMPAGPLIDFGSDALRMLRGFDGSVTSGDHIAVASVEWRQPLLRIERGWGTVPVLLRTIHGAVFFDAGQAWTSAFRLSDVKTSLGVEGTLDLVAGFALPVSVTAGVAWTRDGEESWGARGAASPGGRTGTSAYFRIGPSF